ncbi:MAG TPA: hypothetical protein VK034_28270, partial [Enhygromyxa sp.]|nr:hypothetical protein [Enhygromyxa sp.]
PAALAAFDRALATLAHAPTHSRLLLTYKGRGLTMLELQRVDEAVRDLERALEIVARAGGSPLDGAEIRFALARALARSDPHRARTLARAAHESFVALGEDERALATKVWLELPHQQREDNDNG